ncbi:MAG: phosphoribosylglycinamide formyltransferase [Ginsengibacter sp.]
MLNGLKHYWKVKNKELFLILCTFAIAGFSTALIGKEISEWLSLEKYGLAWWTSKFIVIIFGYQVIILIVGFCFGMFPFFWKYEQKILRRLGIMKKKPIAGNPKSIEKKAIPGKRKQPVHIAIFASGAGSNAQKIIDYFKTSKTIKIGLIVCNNPLAGVLGIAANENIPVLLVQKEKFMLTGYAEELKNRQIGFIVLAGFLWKIPTILINQFPGDIVNIHPALLPAYGGKGMYGNAVHAAVLAAKEKQSGITIHYVDDIYDHGKIIFQSTCLVGESDTIESLAKKVHELEHAFYAEQIEKMLIK